MFITLACNKGILDLKILLEQKRDNHNYTLDVPDHLILQFDNCSENKVGLLLIYY